MDTQRKRTIMSDLSGRTTVVVGASRGLGRGIARAFAEAGAPVVAVARTGPALAELATTSANIRTEIAFTWLREALLKPLPPGSRVVVVSSGAAINGSPASGGYAGSKATQRFIAGYAQDESRRAGLQKLP